MSKPVRVPWAETAEELHTRYVQERAVRRRQRLQALWLVRRGESIAEAAHLAGVGQRSLERWLDWYRHGGVAAVLDRVPGHGASGRLSWLTSTQQQALLAQVATGAFRTYHEARDWVEEQFGIPYTYKGMYTLLARLGVHPKVPRPLATNADLATQEAWKKGGSPPP